jgi:23S rRNA pseudouridine2604 synthase
MAWTRRYDDVEPQRVNRWLAQSGVCSRREAEALIAKGLVSIDGERVGDLGRKILAGQTLTLADDAETELQGRLTILIHKPVGVVSGQPEGRQIPAIRLTTQDALWKDPLRGEGQGAAIQVPDAKTRLAPIGRLDMDSRGLLILSEDGVLAKAVIGPYSELEKEYLVQVEGAITEKKLKLLRHGLELDGRKLKPAQVTVVEPERLRFILKEGRNRQIRRMCEAVGLAVVDLFRLRIGPIDLGDLPEGCWRPLTAGERAAIVQG